MADVLDPGMEPMILVPALSGSTIASNLPTCHCSSSCGAGAGGTCECGSNCGGGA